ncbi:MAG: tRNA epoxyqueuosine(34) reductase QueG [Deltaproteobacteria bacterium]|nr:MAG: tRNA epoxyqueuosine(34) reductase QueG [Deltaproteobacteria bacterium]
MLDRMAVATPTERVAREARLLGFPRAGSTPLGALERGPFLERWLADGRAGEMGYLARRTAERIDPRTAFPWARSIVSLAYPYRPPPVPAGDWRAELRGRIAAYALGVDYHDRVGALLERLIERLRDVFPAARFRPYVDTGPVLEREWAARAGLGWIGKNTLLLHRSAGSYFFLAELLTDLSLDAVPLPADHCGTCTRCLTACPTGALEAYAMDPRRCISYLTIEHRSAIPHELRPHLANWIFGCDLCQVACPWNQAAPEASAAEALAPRLPPLLALDAAGFRARFGRTAVARTKRRGLLRNVAVALGNSGNPDAVPPLAAALGDPEALVRGHAAWALGRLGGAAARRALEGARAREPDPAVAAEIEAALG